MDMTGVLKRQASSSLSSSRYALHEIEKLADAEATYLLAASHCSSAGVHGGTEHQRSLESIFTFFFFFSFTNKEV